VSSLFVNKPFNVDEADNIIIDGVVRYAGTCGLHELIFKRKFLTISITRRRYVQIQEHAAGECVQTQAPAPFAGSSIEKIQVQTHNYAVDVDHTQETEDLEKDYLTQ